MRSAAAIALSLLVAPWLVARWTPAMVYMDNWPDGAPKVRAVSTRTIHGDYEFNGQSRSFYADGSVESEGLYVDGKEQGLWQWFRPDGTALARCEYDRGSGDYKSFHADGSPAWSGPMVDRQRGGLWRGLDQQGRPSREGHYIRGLQDGEWNYWDYGDSVQHYTGMWDAGLLLEADGVPTQSPDLKLSVVEHGGHVLAFLLWIFAPIPLSWLLASRIGETIAERVLGTLVIQLAAQIVLAQLLLALGLFGRWSLLFASAVAFAAGLWACRRSGARLPEFNSGGWVAGSVTLLAVVFTTTRLWSALIEPPDNFDSLAYHLPVMADWVQQGALIHRAELGQVAFYAFGWECLGASTMALLSEDALIAWPNMASLVVLMLSVTILARRLGASDTASAIVSMAMLAIPEVVTRIVAIQPDLPLAACSLSALVFSGFPKREEALRPWPLAASLGLLLALKFTGWVYLLGGAALLFAWRRPKAPLRAWKTWLGPACFALFLGAFWYARNLLLAGNPLGLLELPLIGISGELSAELAHRGSLARLFSPGISEHWSVLLRALHGAFSWAFWAMLALMAAALIRRPRLDRVQLWMFGLFGLSVLVYWNTPYSADNGSNGYQLTGWMQNNLRFAFVALALLAVLAARGLDLLGAWGSRAAMLFLVAGAGWSIVDSVAVRYEALVLSVIMAALCVVVRGNRNAMAAYATMVILLLAVSSYAGRHQRHSARLQRYGSSYEFVLRRVQPGSVLGTAMTQKRYPWVGPRLSRRVRSAVPLRDDAAAWNEQLEHDGVDYLLVGYGSAAERGRVQSENVRPWLEADASPFELLSGFESQRRDVELWGRVNAGP